MDEQDRKRDEEQAADAAEADSPNEASAGAEAEDAGRNQTDDPSDGGQPDDATDPGEPDESGNRAAVASAADWDEELLAAARRSGRRIAAEQNLMVVGTLEVVTHTRTFQLTMDGDAALRLLARFRYGSTWWDDILTPEDSSATDMWAVLDLDAVVALQWVPGRPRPELHQRVAVDPAA